MSVTVDRDLLHAVDLRVAERPDLDRSKVVGEALFLWYAREQQREMAEEYADPVDVDPQERADWRAIQRAAAERLFRPR